MKSISLSLVLWCLGMIAVSAQNNCDAPPAVRAFYERDAQQLAVRMMQNNPAYQDSVAIPNFLYERAMRVLLAVYNATQLHERDTVVECLGIHTFPEIWPYGVAIGLDATQTWAQNFVSGIFPTGNTPFDNIISHNNLTNAGSFEFGNTIYASVRSETALNPVALIHLFEGVQGVQFAEQEGVIGGGNNIQLQETLIEDIEVTYTAAWGDCPAGCISARNWKFRVKLDCGLQFLEVWGQELTEEVGCSNQFQCATEPLCLDWLRDTVAFYQAQFPDCNQPYQGSALTLHEQGSVIGLHFVIGADFEFTNFYTCSGDYLGRCLITIAGQTCDSPDFQEYFANADTFWTCDQPYPTAAECGVLRAPEPPSWAASVQIFPNPTSGLLQVSALFDQRRSGSIQVINVLGQVVLNRNFESTFVNESIDLQRNAPGVYFVRVGSGEQQAVKKVVVER